MRRSGLLSVRLLLGSGRWAGLLAGAAFQFKITFVAALAAGGLWLLVLRRLRDLALFTAAGVSSVWARMRISSCASRRPSRR